MRYTKVNHITLQAKKDDLAEKLRQSKDAKAKTVAQFEKKRGRPRKPVPEPLPSRTIVVYYKVPGSEEVRHLGTHLNVPGDWSRGMILERLGIREHLKVIIKTEGRDSVLQDFPRSRLEDII